MPIEKKQSCRESYHDKLIKEPNYMLSTLAGMWKDEIIEDRRREGHHPEP